MLKHVVSIKWPCPQQKISGSNIKGEGENKYWRQLAVSAYHLSSDLG